MRIVVIAEMNEYTSATNMYSEELDFSTKKVTTDIINALQEKGYNVCHYKTPKDFIDNITYHKNDIVFSTLWGGHHSRNKRTFLSAICEAYNIKFVGADAFVQALCQDKYLTKLYLKNYNFSIPRALQISSKEELQDIKTIEFLPCIIKPNDEACSVGISSESIAYTMDEVKFLAENLLQHYSPILIEEFIGGREISICCAGSRKKLELLEAVEVKVNGNEMGNTVWSFDNKRMGKGESSREVVTGEMPLSLLHEVSTLFHNLGKVDCCRIDGKYIDNKFYIIELSPDCSLSARCFMATAFYHQNNSFSEMLQKLILYAINDYD